MAATRKQEVFDSSSYDDDDGDDDDGVGEEG